MILDRLFVLNFKVDWAYLRWKQSSIWFWTQLFCTQLSMVLRVCNITHFGWGFQSEEKHRGSSVLSHLRKISSLNDGDFEWSQITNTSSICCKLVQCIFIVMDDSENKLWVGWETNPGFWSYRSLTETDWFRCLSTLMLCIVEKNFTGWTLTRNEQHLWGSLTSKITRLKWCDSMLVFLVGTKFLERVSRVMKGCRN